MHRKQLLKISLFILMLCISAYYTNGQHIKTVQEKFPDFSSRKQMLIDSVAEYAGRLSLEEFKESDGFNGGKYGAYLIMALFETGQIQKAREFVAQQLVGGAAMFREFSTMSLYMQYHDKYGPELCERVKSDQLKSNFFDKKNKDGMGGASENHKLMYASAAYLAGIAWPNEYPEEWYQTGYNHLMNWFETVTSIGFWEEDSPTYLIHHMGPILSVAEFAPDGSEMKKRAKMVLDWYFASIAGEYLHGYWITPTARDYNPIYGLANSAETTALTWLYFGDAPQIPFPHIYSKFYHWKATIHFAVSDYELPDIIKLIATHRDRPFVHREFMVKNPMQPKEYCYIAPQYGLASTLGESVNVVPNQTRWKLQWVANDANKEPSVFFMKHPYEKDEWQKWRGASPAEQVIQHENVLVAVYKINENEKPFIDGPFIPGSYELYKQNDGWIFIHTGSCLFAVKAVNGLKITDEKRMTDNHGIVQELGVLKSEGLRNGLIVQTAEVQVYESGSIEKTLDKFMVDVLTRTTIDSSGVNTENPRLSYRSLSGDLIEIAFNQFKKINGKNLELGSWPLLENQWMHQDVNGKELFLKFKHEKRIYDFANWTVKQ